MRDAADVDLKDAPEDERTLLKTGLDRLDLAPSAGQLDRLLRYVAEIELWNPRLKLVGASGHELIVRHIFDSLAGWSVLRGHLKQRSRMERSADAERSPDAGAPVDPVRVFHRVADLGTGAGLPGIPIAIMEPELRVDLVERSGRRAGFLRNAVAAARVDNASVCQQDAHSYDANPDLVVFRAFVPLGEDLLASLRRIVGPRGVICAYKGRLEVVREELEGVPAERTTIVAVHVPFLNAERHLVLFE